jgi:hypothetical protein
VSVTTRHHLLVSTVGLVTFATIGWITPAASEPSTGAPNRTIVASSDEAGVLWNWLKDSGDRSQLERFIKRYPDSPYANEAKERLESLRRDVAPAKPTGARAASTSVSPPTFVVASHPNRPPWECFWFWCSNQYPVVLGVGF